MKETSVLEHQGRNGGPIVVSKIEGLEFDNLNADEQETLLGLLRKAKGPAA